MSTKRANEEGDREDGKRRRGLDGGAITGDELIASLASGSPSGLGLPNRVTKQGVKVVGRATAVECAAFVETFDVDDRNAISQFLVRLGLCRTALVHSTRAYDRRYKIRDLVRAKGGDPARLIAALRRHEATRCRCRTEGCTWKPVDLLAIRLAREGARLVPEDPDAPSVACLPMEILVLIMRYLAPDFETMRAARETCLAVRLAVDAAVFPALADCRIVELVPASGWGEIAYGPAQLLASPNTRMPEGPERGVIWGHAACKRTMWAWQNPAAALARTVWPSALLRQCMWRHGWIERLEPVLYAFPSDDMVDRVRIAASQLGLAEARFGNLPIESLMSPAQRRNKTDKEVLESFIERTRVVHAILEAGPRIEEARQAAHARHAPLFALERGVWPYLRDAAAHIYKRVTDAHPIPPETVGNTFVGCILETADALDQLVAEFGASVASIGLTDITRTLSVKRVREAFLAALTAKLESVLSTSDLDRLATRWRYTPGGSQVPFVPDETDPIWIASQHLRGRILLRGVFDYLTKNGGFRPSTGGDSVLAEAIAAYGPVIARIARGPRAPE